MSDLQGRGWSRPVPQRWDLLPLKGHLLLAQDPAEAPTTKGKPSEARLSLLLNCFPPGLPCQQPGHSARGPGTGFGTNLYPSSPLFGDHFPHFLAARSRIIWDCWTTKQWTQKHDPVPLHAPSQATLKSLIMNPAHAIVLMAEVNAYQGHDRDIDGRPGLRVRDTGAGQAWQLERSWAGIKNQGHGTPGGIAKNWGSEPGIRS